MTTPTQAIPIEVLKEHQYQQTWLPWLPYRACRWSCACGWSVLPGKYYWYDQWIAHLSQFAIPVGQPVVQELIAEQREKDAETVRRFALAGHAQDAEWAIRSQQEKP